MRSKFYSNKFYIFGSIIVGGILCTLLIPDNYLLLTELNAPDPVLEKFSCGGGPFSIFMATLISTTCDRQPIDSCCVAHDNCYDSLHLNQTFCDEIFCGCLSEIPDSVYCQNVAHSGLCLATQVFGHMFHWSANCTVEGECFVDKNDTTSYNQAHAETASNTREFATIKNL